MLRHENAPAVDGGAPEPKYTGKASGSGHASTRAPNATATGAMTLAVADPTRAVLLIDRHNRGAGWCELHEVPDGHAYAVRVRDGLVAIDVDDPDHASVPVMQAAIRRAGVVPVVVASGTPRRVHVWCRVDTSDGRVDVLRDALPGLDVRAPGDLVRPPLSPHRLGHEPALVDPADPDDAVAALCASDAPSLDTLCMAALHEGTKGAATGLGGSLRHDRHSHVDATTALGVCDTSDAQPPPARRRRDPSPRVAQLIARGDIDRRYASRSEAVAAAAMGLVDAGLDDDDAARSLARMPEVKQRGREPGRRGVMAYAHAEVRRAREAYERRGDRADRTAALSDLERAAATIPWPRGQGSHPATLAAVLGAVLRTAVRAGSTRLEYSTRQAADDAGVARGAADRALRVLVDLEVLRLARRGGRRQRAAYVVDAAAIHERACLGGTVTHTPRRRGPTVPPRHGGRSPLGGLAAHDGWRRDAAGKSAQRIAEVLDEEDTATSAAVAAGVGVSRPWARRLLRRMARDGLVVAEPDGWRRPAPDALRSALDRVAVRCNTAGRGQRQREAHARERRAHALRVALEDRKRRDRRRDNEPPHPADDPAFLARLGVEDPDPARGPPLAA